MTRNYDGIMTTDKLRLSVAITCLIISFELSNGMSCVGDSACNVHTKIKCTLN